MPSLKFRVPYADLRESSIDRQFMSVRLGALRCATLPLDRLAGEIWQGIDSGEKRQWLACLNPHSIATMQVSSEFAGALKQAKWLIADGVGLRVAMRVLLGARVPRTIGPEVFHATMDILNARGGKSVFFLGSTESNLLRLSDAVRSKYPKVRIAGSFSPPFRDEFVPQDDDVMVAAVLAASPDVLWVGMTAPKQELWIARNIGRLEVCFAGAIGAAFDFASGAVPYPPQWVERLGLIWLYRLVRQPGRLWRRTLISAPKFMLYVLRARFSGEFAIDKGESHAAN